MTMHFAKRVLLSLTLPLVLVTPFGCRGTSGDVGANDGREGDGITYRWTHYTDLEPLERAPYAREQPPLADNSQWDADKYYVEDTRDLTDDVVVDELGDEGAVADDIEFGAAQGREDCGLKVIAASPDAVAQPCMTTEAFMQSLGLTEAEMAHVRANAALP